MVCSAAYINSVHVHVMIEVISIYWRLLQQKKKGQCNGELCEAISQTLAIHVDLHLVYFKSGTNGYKVVVVIATETWDIILLE